MTTLTEMVAAVVVQSSAAAFSHFGVTLETPPEPPARVAAADPRVVARSHPRQAVRVPSPVEKAAGCPDAPHARIVKA